jgi:hypothetical protein
VAVGDCVGRTSLYAISTKNAAVVVDVVDLGIAFGAGDALGIGIFRCLDINAVRWASCRAQEAGDAFFQTIFVALQNMLAPETLFKVSAFVSTGAVGIILDLRRLKHFAESDAHTLGNRSGVFEHGHRTIIGPRSCNLAWMKRRPAYLFALLAAIPAAALAQAAPAVPDYFEHCKFSDDIAMVNSDQRTSGLTRTVATSTGPKQIPVIAGQRLGYAYPNTDFFANVRVEMLPADTWQLEVSDLKRSIDDDAAATPGILPASTQGKKVSGVEIYGMNRTRIEDEMMGKYLLIDPKTNILTTIYFLNQDPARRKYQSMQEYEALRDSFLTSYSACMANPK